MSWSDPCSECGQHRADCDCGDWNGYKRKAEEEKKKKRLGVISYPLPGDHFPKTIEEVKEMYENGQIHIIVLPKKVIKDD